MVVVAHVRCGPRSTPGFLTPRQRTDLSLLGGKTNGPQTEVFAVGPRHSQCGGVPRLDSNAGGVPAIDSASLLSPASR